MVLLYTFLLAATASAKCYEASIAHPLPDLDSNDAVLKHAFAKINTALTFAVAAPEFASASFSIEITSSKETLWSRHHTARERNASRPDIPEVNGDALYRIASITKTFTVLSILYQHQAGNLSLDDPVNKYIKELRADQEGTIPWEDITLRSLASQLSGIPREFAQGDIINVGNSGLPDALELGLPLLSRKGLVDCDEYSPNYEKPCNANDLLDVVKSKRPLFAPNMKSTYSNVAFELLGLVLEKVTNRTYKSYIDDAIFKPLNMSKSTLSLPPDSAGVIPLNPQYWDVDAGIQNPTGGIYSSTADLSKYLRYILTHYNTIAGLNWLHPVSPSGGLNSFYGMPWEILHTDRVLKDSRRMVRFITKGGGLPGYTSIIAMVPDLDIAFTILVGGEGSIFHKLLDAVSTKIIQAAEEISVRQLQERYVGTYTSTNHTLNSSITIVADTRGLIVERFVSNGTDILGTFLKRFSRGPSYPSLEPTLLFRDEKKQQGELWRMLVTNERAEDEGSIWDDFCIADFDGPLYAGVGFNELAFWNKGRDGKFGAVELSAFRVNLTRTESDKTTVWNEQEAMEL
ncbi:beta-lactamase/transpeptidase-like protein [Ophiobolus disseminans]|uniref:Beta-lactamase/transpeptidase-like protein n=1 Tax=Ophiobolus disseminans TaxID=1469910 RepID=A0A6A7A0H1_9PLEO|nr:beta-lactamase/transpeptidase-like protein [Ophiobolus disseminans]